MGAQASCCVEALATWFARQPVREDWYQPHGLQDSLRGVKSHFLGGVDKPVEHVEALSLASLPSACQLLSPVQHWHRHKHKLVPLVPNLDGEKSSTKETTNKRFSVQTFFALVFFLNRRPWSSSWDFETKVKLISSSSKISILSVASSSENSVSSARVTSRNLLDADGMLEQRKTEPFGENLLKLGEIGLGEEKWKYQMNVQYDCNVLRSIVDSHWGLIEVHWELGIVLLRKCRTNIAHDLSLSLFPYIGHKDFIWKATDKSILEVWLFAGFDFVESKCVLAGSNCCDVTFTGCFCFFLDFLDLWDFFQVEMCISWKQLLWCDFYGRTRGTSFQEGRQRTNPKYNKF